MTRALPLALAGLLALAGPARADVVIPPPSTFAAEPAAGSAPGSTAPSGLGAPVAAAPSPTAEAANPKAAVTAAELPEMLKQCDAQLRACERGAELCEKDRTGVGFLGAAYLGLWALLLGYFFVTRRRQQRLMADLRALEARLARLSGAAEPGTSGRGR
jgi:hypothetical protein